MAETCIVCLGDLRTASGHDAPLVDPDDAATTTNDASSHDNHVDNNLNDDAIKVPRFKQNGKSPDNDEEIIAHLLPCKHDLHNACLKPWVERANSCPICRAVFNTVELIDFIDGPVVDSYVVQDKVQQAEIDPTMIIDEDELFAVEIEEPCLMCKRADETYESMFCDGCDRSVHVFCAGFEDSPEVWYCKDCLSDFESDLALPGVASALSRDPRRSTRGLTRRARHRSNDAMWARVWQAVSRRLDFDLDFPFDDDARTDEQRREYQQWERRLRVGSTQGATTRLRDIAAARLRNSVTAAPAPESQEEIRAWNAFNKARESHDAPHPARRRKRRATDSPSSPRQADAGEQPQLKRPRLRRPPTSVDVSALQQSGNGAESSSAAQHRVDENNTFLSSLLKDVENKPISATSPTASDYPNGTFSPRNSSPARSPDSSGHATPRANSATPPPQRPMSPPLSSTIVPIHSPLPITFSPFSPTGARAARRDSNGAIPRGRSRQRVSPQAKPRAGSQSPSDALSYSTKQEIQRMVKAALGSRYRDKTISKDQYTDINRDVSRKLYELIGDASALSDHSEREKWQLVADAEVKKAISMLQPEALLEDSS